jgi:signal peptidase I
LVLLGSSRKEVVSYPSQKVIYIKSKCPIQPCGMHGYGFGCKKGDEKLFVSHEKTRCIYNDYRCINIIKPGVVISEFVNMIKPILSR